MLINCLSFIKLLICNPKKICSVIQSKHNTLVTAIREVWKNSDGNFPSGIFFIHLKQIMYKDYPKVKFKKTKQNKTHPALFGQSLEENVQFDTSVLSL